MPSAAVLLAGAMGATNTRDRLLRAAAMEIARHSFKGASLRGVAARAEIRAASIFHYFPGGKEELARAMLEHIMETIGTRMTPTIDALGLPAPKIEKNRGANTSVGAVRSANT